jgi:hypothetical protein
MGLRGFLLTGVALLALCGCESGFNPFGDSRAGAPDTSLAGVKPAAARARSTPQATPQATPESNNREMSFFLTDNLIHLRKYPRALRVAAVVGAQPMDLKSWPGAIVADEIQVQATKCGTPVEFVRLDQDFDLLVGFTHRERDGDLDKQDRAKLADALTRNRMRAAQSLADILDVELEVTIDTDVGSAKGEYPFDRWHQFLNYKVPEAAHLALLPRMPVETWREHYDKVVAEIGPMAPDSQAKRDRTEEFRIGYLNEVMAICPNNFFADLMRRAGVDVSPDLVTSLLRDGRVQEGMTREQFQQASLSVLNAMRPGL